MLVLCWLESSCIILKKLNVIIEFDLNHSFLQVFDVGVMGLCVIVPLKAKDRIKGSVNFLIDLLMAMVVMNLISSVDRLTFRQWKLGDGLAQRHTFQANL